MKHGNINTPMDNMIKALFIALAAFMCGVAVGYVESQSTDVLYTLKVVQCDESASSAGEHTIKGNP